MTKSPRQAGVALFALTALALTVVLVPVGLIRPFAAQPPWSVALAFALRRWSPLITLGTLVLVLLVGARLWRTPRRPLPRAGVALAALLALSSAWLSRQDYFEWVFRPLPDPRFVRAKAAAFVAPGDMVLAVAGNGEAAAYPVRQLAYHHLVEDAIGGVPIVATY
jgi:hypothetical protein